MPGGASSGDGKVFAGVRFVLFGFDSVSEVQYRSELIRGGGVDVGRYDPSCTHVIVSGRLYDDPVCVAARNDGKIVVTELWIEDSVDVGAVTDVNKILYRPVRDLNGIPGSGSLFICLTGYQRQERDTIMKMVSLMGAHFSKPLIAAKVTHLVCYKFEGEKYDLAKRVNIKLVNHRWLEDCLKAWEILPVDDYGRSGWELEIMEAEARDSDEETEEDPNVKQLAQGIVTDCLPRIVPMSTVSKGLSPAVGTLTIQQGVSGPDKTLYTANQFLSTPPKESMSVRTSNDNGKVLGDFGNKTNMGGRNSYLKETSHNEVPVVPENAVNLNKQSNIFTPDSTGKTITCSDSVVGKVGCLGYSQKKPRPSLSTEDVWKRIDSFQEKLQGNDVSISPLKQDPSNFAFAAIQSPATFGNLNCKEGPSSASHLKRKIAVPRFDSVSPNSGYGNLKASAPEKSLGASMSVQLKSVLSDNAQEDKAYPLGDERIPSDVTDLASLMVHQDRSSSKSNSATHKQKTMKHSSTLRANATTPFSDVQVTNLFYHNASMQQLDNRESTCEDQRSLETGVCNGTLSPTGSKLINFQDRNPVVSPSCKIVTRNNVKSLSPLSTNGQDADSMPPKCETLKTTLLKESAECLQPEKGGVSVTELSNIQSGTRQIEKLTNEKSSHCAGVRISPNSADSVIHPNSSAKTLTKKAIANRKLGCKLKTSVTSNTGGTACSDDLVKVKNRNLEGNSVRNTEIVATLSKDAVTEDLVRGCNSVCKDSKESVGVSMDFHLTEKAIARESSSRLVKVQDLTLKEAVDDRKSKRVKSVSGDVTVQQKVKNVHKALKTKGTKNVNVAKTQTSSDADKENNPEENVLAPVKSGKHGCLDMRVKDGETLDPKCKIIDEITSNQQRSHQLQKVISEPAWFILSGHRWQRKEFQMIIRRLRGRLCNDSHHWSYKATHFIVPEPVRRTEKFFAAAASGRWILKTDYLTASKEAGKFLEEETFEWHRNGLTEDGTISLEAPRKWRRLRECTGHGAFYGMRIITYGESILPPMDTLKRVVKAGDGTILATSPPYTRFLKSGVDFAVIGAGMPHVDSWIQQFRAHEIPCILADYLVEYVCKPGFPLDKHVLYKTHAWAEKSFANLLKRSEEIAAADDPRTSSEDPDDLCCSVCGSRDRGEVMLVCGDESGLRGCGIGIHIDCCNPPLDAVPDSDWFCADCAEKGARKAPAKGRRKT